MTIAVEYNFIPATIFSFPQYRGLTLNIVVQKADVSNDGPEGPPLSAVPISSVVLITVQVTSPDDVGPITVQVPMPAGLEPIDPAIAPDLPQLCEFPFIFGGFFSSFFWFTCPDLTVIPQLVEINFSQFGTGTKAAQFFAVAATEGDFLFPSALAFADD